MPNTIVKYVIVYNSVQIMDPENPLNPLLFDSQADAETYIATNELPAEQCQIFTITITE